MDFFLMCIAGNDQGCFFSVDIRQDRRIINRDAPPGFALFEGVLVNNEKVSAGGFEQVGAMVEELGMQASPPDHDTSLSG